MQRRWPVEHPREPKREVDMFTPVKSHLTWFVAAFAAIAVLLCSSRPAAAYPPAGTDEFDSAATITIDFSFSGGPVMTETVTGPTRIERGTPFNPGDGRWRIETEIVSMELRGTTAFGPITVKESPTERSTGYVKQKMGGIDFPADSFFDVFVQMDTPLGRLHNNDPIGMSAVIHEIPPFEAMYEPPIAIPVDLFNEAGDKVGVITHAQHFVGQKASFSVAPLGPSGLLPADIFDVPTVLRIPAASLGLMLGDDLDGLSYGLEYIGYNMGVRFSVAHGAAGVPGSAVATEAAKAPSEAHGDEFAVSPPLPVGGSNIQVLDETGNTAPPFPLLISDDVDALADQPASFVDTDGDTVPDAGKPVYFSLAPGSPTLLAIGATPADILVNKVPPAPPAVFLAGAALGLVPGDDIDDFCLDTATLTVLFSLAPGSPTLVAVGASPSDLFLVRAPPIAPPPPVFVPAASLGLLATDDLNALKCIWPVPSIGGIAELPDVAGPSPEEAGTHPGGSGWSAGNYAALGGGLAAALLVLSAGAWYARRRWVR
jgi:hypothetical protein